MFATPVTAQMIGLWLHNETIHSNVIIGTTLILSELVFYEWGNVIAGNLYAIFSMSRIPW